MATKKVRVYELARELGVENAVVLELAEELRIGVKSHSSSIDDPSADRIRRLADSRGLRKEPPPKPVEKPKASSARKVVSTRSSQVAKTGTPLEEPSPRRTVRSKVEESVVVPPMETEAEAPLPAAAQVSSPEPEPEPEPEDDGAPPRSLSGKLIPPPPGARKTPPPAAGPRTPMQRTDAPRAARPQRSGPVFPRSGEVSFPRNFADRSGRGGPGGGAPGAGAGAPGGDRRGRGGGAPGQRQGQRKKKKSRRRMMEEDFGPASAPALTPSDVAVPEGEIVVSRGITVQELAPKLNRTTADLVKILFEAGEMVTGTQSLADEMVELIAEELGAEVLLVEPGEEAEAELQALFTEDEEDDALAEPRAPVVTVMGHVDHGKTTLLDKIRSTDVVGGEAGGITQAIGAYQAVHNGHPITFIDTPGHEAFTAMRARGARATDIAVLVVAADDGVMPQTIEAINHARAAEVPIVVAVTKTDRDDADPTRVRQQLVEQELVPEEWGGDTVVVDVSAKTGAGIDNLLEAVLLVGEVEELTANPKAPPRALVLESNLEPGRGVVVTVLVESGTIRLGDPVVAGNAWGRVRAMFNERGEQVQEAGPSVPVLLLGLDDVPLAGDELRVAPTDKIARKIADARGHRRRAAGLSHREVLAGGAPLEEIFEAVQRGEVATLNLLVKADSQGSLEALTESLRKVDQEHEEVRLSFVLRGVGGITESDINLAAVSNATVIGFNVRPDRKAREVAEAQKVELRLYEIIYKILEDVQAALVGLLKPEYEEIVTGEAEVREIFSVPKLGKIAGCFVNSGVITRGSKVRFLREGTIIWKGTIVSLRRFKDDVKEVRESFECGIGLENFTDLKPGDIIETYEEREIARA